MASRDRCGTSFHSPCRAAAMSSGRSRVSCMIPIHSTPTAARRIPDVNGFFGPMRVPETVPAPSQIEPIPANSGTSVRFCDFRDLRRKRDKPRIRGGGFSKPPPSASRPPHRGEPGTLPTPARVSRTWPPPSFLSTGRDIVCQTWRPGTRPTGPSTWKWESTS